MRLLFSQSFIVLMTVAACADTKSTEDDTDANGWQSASEFDGGVGGSASGGGGGGEDTSVSGGTDGGGDDGAAGDADGDAGGEPDEGAGEELTPEDMPANPGSFTVTFSDGNSLEFDLPSCSYYRGSSNFRMFWRNEARTHVYVMIIEAMSLFDGVGSYSSNDGTVRVKLQQEAGGSSGASAYKADGSDGGEVIVTVDYLDEDIAWGGVSITSMHDTTRDVPVTVTPTTFPVWCSDLAI
jgi:hypothetical protein